MAVSGFGRRLPIVVILGATGAGKSKLALQLAERFNGEIISTDAMQVYKKLDIVTNKVTAAEMDVCPHHMIDVISPLTTNYTIVQFRNAALPLINDIMSRQRIPFLVGGTNYYIEALLWKLLIDSQVTSDPVTSESLTSHSAEKVTSDPVTSDRLTSDPVTSEKVTSEPTACDRLNSEAVPHEEKNCEPLTSGKAAPTTEEHSNNRSISSTDTTEPTLTREQLQKMETQELYLMLMNVDSERAQRLHPNDRRKIIRSLEVFYQEGRPMSDLLRDQHRETGEGAVSGPLRYTNPCIIWVQCEQDVLDARTDARVDQMIEQGLIQELTDFHTEYNMNRQSQHREFCYTEGIFQSIGFKEFHNYLVLTEAERESEHGKNMLQKGIEDMKIATRQYSRYQKKWITKRFLKRRGGNVPKVYGVDSTDKSRWDVTALTPACDVLNSFLKGEEAPFPALPQDEINFNPEYNKCDICDVVTVTADAWQIHIQGRRHKKTVNHIRQVQALETRLLAGTASDPSVERYRLVKILETRILAGTASNTSIDVVTRAGTASNTSVDVVTKAGTASNTSVDAVTGSGMISDPDLNVAKQSGTTSNPDVDVPTDSVENIDSNGDMMDPGSSSIVAISGDIRGES